MTHPPQDQLSLYLDADLDVAQRGLLEAHLAECTTCAALLADLRRVMARARALDDRPPRADLWPGVAAAIGATPSPRRRFSLSIPQLLAAGIVCMLLSGSVVAGAMRLGDLRPGAAARSELPPATIRSVHAAPERGYEAALRQLETELRAGQELDSMTVRVIEDKLRLIDRAIHEAERALAADPANAYLTGHLTDTRMRKLDLLRQATALSRAVS
jgi:Putative zinc-finger